MPPMTEAEKQAIAQKLREIADILAPQRISAQGGGNGNGPPRVP